MLPAVLVCYPLSRVMYAAFARMRDDRERVAGVWMKGFTTLSAIALPALFGLIVNGFVIPGRSATTIGTALEAIPGALIGIGLIYAEGVRRERAGYAGSPGV